jgi:ABC-type phosphate transport system substrate-binding protein
MQARFIPHHLLGTVSALALSATALIGSAAPQPAAAAQGIYGGGSTLLSLAARQIFDCYHGASSPVTTCTIGALPSVTGLYAGVGSGSGLRAFIANDAHLLLQSPTGLVFPLPANPPPYVDGTGASPFGLYPYPELDFAASDSPLPNSTTIPGWNANSLTTASFSGFTPATNWQTLPPTTTTVAAAASTTTTYSTAKYGQPIQLPAAEVPVAIAVNVATTAAATWTIRSALTPNSQAGGAIQLSAAQLCAIFSGQVRDWSSNLSISELDTVAGAPVLTPRGFNADNTNSSIHTGVNYTSSSLPIRVVYRTDGSGTSFIITNYLAAVCPLLDDGTNNYTKIFTGVGRTVGATANLPSTSFSTLIANIQTVTGVNVIAGANPWVGALGSEGVALAINNDSVNSGRIGYLSNDFTKAYSSLLTAPLSASVQNENLRANGVNHPGDSGTVGSPQNFIAPTPTNADNAWKHLTAPAAPATYAAWNVYDQKFTSGTSGGLPLAGKFILPLDTDLNAYPITGTTFLELYSCYADAAGARVPAVANFLSWLVGVGEGAVGTPSTSTAATPKRDVDVGRVLQVNGFHELRTTLAHALIQQYVTPGINNTAIAAYNPSGSQTQGCIGVTGGGAH